MTVAEGWAALVAAVSRNPDMALDFQPPPEIEEIAQAEAQTETLWPDQLRTFYTLQNGQATSSKPYVGELLPMAEIFSLARLIDEHTSLVEDGRQAVVDDPNYFPFEGTHDAGTEAGVFLPSYIPFGGSDGKYYYYCDTRQGQHRGCVRLWSRDEDDAGPPLWPSISAMLAAVTRALTDGSKLDHMWIPSSINGELTWMTAEELATPDGPAPPDPIVVSTGFEVLTEPSPSHRPDLLYGPVDYDAARRAVLDEVVANYGATSVSDAQPAGFIPQQAGFIGSYIAIVDEREVLYAVVVSPVEGEFVVAEVPPGGIKFVL